MSDQKLQQFTNRDFLNLETFRKNGQGVPTPVWFVVDDQGVVYIRTGADSGKVKRIRNNPRVRVAPCDARGGLLGEWVDAQVQILEPDELPKVDELMKDKYGMQKMFFDLMSRLSRMKSVVLAVWIEE